MKKNQLVTLGKHIDILSGCAFPSSGFNRNNGVPLIRIRDILSGKTETYYEGSYDLKYLIKKGDLLVGMDGDFNREYWKGTDALLNQRVCKITPNPETLDKNFLYHFLQ
ncbi:TPA: restriction endonuclease, partial [Escherichia coli]|nr:restriction endonuclease [Escherichia coli]HCO0379741.1 restriction endonuclease subunit S [Escherichia coli]HDO7253244.1 restriction endonuclease subunit S [Escherichia coli]HDV2562867.1 restriction endonuclease subunit S [Escherichia coli]